MPGGLLCPYPGTWQLSMQRSPGLRHRGWPKSGGYKAVPGFQSLKGSQKNVSRSLASVEQGECEVSGDTLNCPHDFDQVLSGLCISGSPSVQMRAVGPHSGLWKSGELAFVTSCLCPLSTPPRQSPRHWVTVPPPPNTCPQPAGIRQEWTDILEEAI